MSDENVAILQFASLLCDSIDVAANRYYGYQFSMSDENVAILQFADNAVVIGNSISSLCHQTDKFLKWFKSEAKVAKCRIMAYDSRPTVEFYEPKIKLAGEIVPFVGNSETWFFGMLINIFLFGRIIKETLLSKLQCLLERVDLVLLGSAQISIFNGNINLASLPTRLIGIVGGKRASTYCYVLS